MICSVKRAVLIYLRGIPAVVVYLFKLFCTLDFTYYPVRLSWNRELILIMFMQALLQALGDRKGINRFGDFSAPLDEALIHVALVSCQWPVKSFYLALKSLEGLYYDHLIFIVIHLSECKTGLTWSKITNTFVFETHQLVVSVSVVVKDTLAFMNMKRFWTLEALASVWSIVLTDLIPLILWSTGAEHDLFILLLFHVLKCVFIISQL